MVDDRVNFCRVSGHWTRPLGRVVNGSAVSKESNRTVSVERCSWVSIKRRSDIDEICFGFA